MSVTFVRPWDHNPVCCHCREPLDFWIFGLAYEKHAHPECAGKAAANAALDKAFKRMDRWRKPSAKPMRRK